MCVYMFVTPPSEDSSFRGKGLRGGGMWLVVPNSWRVSANYPKDPAVLQILQSRLSFPATEPPEIRRVSEGL